MTTEVGATETTIRCDIDGCKMIDGISHKVGSWDAKWSALQRKGWTRTQDLRDCCPTCARQKIPLT